MEKFIKKIKENLSWIFNRDSMIAQHRCDAVIESNIWLLQSIKKDMESLNKTENTISAPELMDIVCSNVNKLFDMAQKVALDERKKK